jgi:hypothetical protein
MCNTDLIDECAPEFLSRRAVRRRDDERNSTFGEKPDERAELRVQSISGDERAQVRQCALAGVRRLI